MSGAQENKALPVAQRRPGDPVVNDWDDRSLLLSRSRPDAEPQQGERGRNQARQGRGREHYLPTMPRFARHDASFSRAAPSFVGHGHIGGHVEPVARSDRSSLPLLPIAGWRPCPPRQLSGVDRTNGEGAAPDANDPERTWRDNPFNHLASALHRAMPGIQPTEGSVFSKVSAEPSVLARADDHSIFKRHFLVRLPRVP